MRAHIAVGICLALAIAAPAHAEPDWAAVGKALGKSGAQAPGQIYRVGLPRSDLKVKLDGVELKPALALGSWLAFQPMGNHDAMVMGDLVLTQPEVNPVMKKLVEGGLEVTALHNHLLRSEPATMYMHVSGHGDAVKLAAALHAGAVEEVGSQRIIGPRTARPQPAISEERARRTTERPPQADQKQPRGKKRGCQPLEVHS